MSQKERIVEQAMQMFVRHGIKAVRMDDIAQELAVSKRTLYELFGDKEELLFLAMNCYFDQREQEHIKLTKGAENVLQAMFMVLNDAMESSDATHRMMTNLRKFYPTTYDRLMVEGKEKHHKCMRESLEQGIKEGHFLPELNIDLSMSLMFFTAMALFTRTNGLTVPEQMSEKEAYLQIVTTLFRGVSTPKGVELIDTYRAEHPNTK